MTLSVNVTWLPGDPGKYWALDIGSSRYHGWKPRSEWAMDDKKHYAADSDAPGDAPLSGTFTAPKIYNALSAASVAVLKKAVGERGYVDTDGVKLDAEGAVVISPCTTCGHRECGCAFFDAQRIKVILEAASKRETPESRVLVELCHEVKRLAGVAGKLASSERERAKDRVAIASIFEQLLKEGGELRSLLQERMTARRGVTQPPPLGAHLFGIGPVRVFPTGGHSLILEGQPVEHSVLSALVTASEFAREGIRVRSFCVGTETFEGPFVWQHHTDGTSSIPLAAPGTGRVVSISRDYHFGLLVDNASLREFDFWASVRGFVRR